jgi:Tol biopolymer transport system component
MTKTYILFISACCCLLSCSGNKEQKTGLESPVYPSPAPGTTAQVFLPGIVSADTLDFNAAFSPGGQTFYFSRSYNRKYCILESRFNGKTWTTPVPSSLFDTAYSNTDPFFSQEGDLYFISNRPKNRADTTDDYDIYRLAKSNHYQGMPQRLDEINSDSTEYYVSLAANGNIYFASYRDGNLDLYRSRKTTGHYEKPVNLGPVINSSADEHDPLIAPDESWLVFTSNRPGGMGEADLYIAFKKNNQWQPPRNMGDRVNTKTYEYCPNISPDGKYFFFSSESDVKWISSKVLKQ